MLKIALKIENKNSHNVMKNCSKVKPKRKKIQLVKLVLEQR